jgi:hypothetical protein
MFKEYRRLSITIEFLEDNALGIDSLGEVNSLDKR